MFYDGKWSTDLPQNLFTNLNFKYKISNKLWYYQKVQIENGTNFIFRWMEYVSVNTLSDDKSFIV